jgi:arginine exporter protein ArgO
MKKTILTSAALMALAVSSANAQVDHSVVSYRVVLSQNTVNSAPFNTAPSPNLLRYAVAVDSATNTLYTIAQQAATPFDDYLFSINLGTLSATLLNPAARLDDDPAFGTITNRLNLTSRAFVFEGGRLIATSQGTASESGVFEFNTTNGVVTTLNTVQTVATPIVGFVHLSGNVYAAQEGSFSGGTGELRLFTIGSGFGASVEATPNAQGLAKDSSGNLYVVAQTGTAAATIKRIADVTTTPVVTDVTPTSTDWTSENMTNTRGILIANDDIYVYKRGTATATDGRLYVVRGGNLIATLTAQNIADGISALPGFSGSSFDIQDTHGIAVKAEGSAQNKVYIGARSVTGGWGVAEITFGAANVSDWLSY